MDDEDAELLAEPFDNGAGGGRSADDNPLKLQGREIEVRRVVDVLEEAEPDCRHAKRERAFLLDREVEQALAVELWPGKHELGATHRGRIGGAPGVDVEQRHHEQHAVGAGQPKTVRRADPVSYTHLFSPYRVFLHFLFDSSIDAWHGIFCS